MAGGGRSGRPIDPQDRLTTIDHGVRGAASEAVLEPPGGTKNKYASLSLSLSLSLSRQMMLGTIGNRTPDLSLTFYSLILCAPVHFWAPTFKWGISLANVADFQSPIEKVSVPQQCGKGRCETQI